MRLFTRIPLVLSLTSAAACTQTFIPDRTTVVLRETAVAEEAEAQPAEEQPAEEQPYVEGDWNAAWSGGDTAIHLVRRGRRVWGRYGGSASGRVEGELVGNELRGAWVGDGATSGRFVFVFTDANHFNGTWGNGRSRSDGGFWNGSRG